MPRADREYRFTHLRCRRCGCVGTLQYKGYRPRYGGKMLSAKCLVGKGGCGKITHVEAEKAATAKVS